MLMKKKGTRWFHRLLLLVFISHLNILHYYRHRWLGLIFEERKRRSTYGNESVLIIFSFLFLFFKCIIFFCEMISLCDDTRNAHSCFPSHLAKNTTIPNQITFLYLYNISPPVRFLNHLYENQTLYVIQFNRKSLLAFIYIIINFYHNNLESGLGWTR